MTGRGRTEELSNVSDHVKKKKKVTETFSSKYVENKANKKIRQLNKQTQNKSLCNYTWLSNEPK